MCSQGAQTFSDAETAQMLTLLSLSASDLELMLSYVTGYMHMHIEIDTSIGGHLHVSRFPK